MPDTDLLKRASAGVHAALHEMLTREHDLRHGWEQIGAALLLARNQFEHTHKFGAWVSSEGLDKLPGLASAASRSDCIWLAERPLCAALVPGKFSHPRKIREFWRGLLAKSAMTWTQSGALPESILHHVTQETHATDEEAMAALHAAQKTLQAVLQPKDALAAVPVTKAEAALLAAMVRAKKAGVNDDQFRDVAACAGFAVHPPAKPEHPWTPPEEADTPALRFEFALKMALIEGVMPAEIDAMIPTVTYYNADMAAERFRAALALAKEQALDLDEAKAIVKDCYLGDF